MRVLLADNQVKERKMLRRLLEQDPELYLMGEATETQDLLTQAQAIQPDLLLLDWELPGLQGTDLFPALHCLGCPLKVVAFSERTEALQEALKAGVDALVSKEEPIEQLLNAVRAVCWLSPCFVD